MISTCLAGRGSLCYEQIGGSWLRTLAALEQEVQLAAGCCAWAGLEPALVSRPWKRVCVGREREDWRCGF